MFKFAAVLFLVFVQRCQGTELDQISETIKKHPTWSFEIESVDTLVQKGLSAMEDTHPDLSEDVLREKLNRHIGPDAKYILRKSWDPKWPKAVPQTFDLRQEYKECAHLIGDIDDEGPCHTETPFTVASVATDRYCIYTNGTHKEKLSVEWLAACAEYCTKGPSQYLSYRWATYVGIPTGGVYHSNKGCVPYTHDKCTHGPADYVSESTSRGRLGKKHKKKPCTDVLTYDHECPKKCSNSKYSKSLEDDLKKFSTYYYISSNEYAIRAEICARGPVTTSLVLFSDFYDYKEGLYYRGENATLLAWDRFVKLIGWGETAEGTKYWLAVNSWSDWGDNKVFKILRGRNYLYVEYILATGTFDPL